MIDTMDSLMNHAPCGFIEFTEDGVILKANQTLLSWLGYNSDELVGKNVEVVFTLASRMFYNTHFFPLIKLHAKAEEIFLALSARDKNTIPVVTNAVLTTQEGVNAVQCVFIPVHQRRKYEDELLKAKRDAENALRENDVLQDLKNTLEKRTLELDQQYQKQLAINENLVQFNKIISHDLQEPLRKIQLFSNLLFDAPPDAGIEKRKSYDDKLNKAVERLRKLVTGLHQYVSVDLENVHPNVSLSEVVTTASLRASKQRNFTDFDLICETLPSIGGFKVQLELLMFHLFDNAIQYRESSRRLRIEVSAVRLEENVFRYLSENYAYKAFVRLYIKDNGVGFDNAYKHQVFGLLQKINTSSTGIGIGLSLVKKIVENHFGSITIESEAGTGTSVIVTLPVVAGSS